MTGSLPKVAKALADAALHPHYHKWNPLRNLCNVCKRKTLFLCADSTDRWIRRCLWCRSTPKYRAIVWVLEERLGRSLAAFLGDPMHRLYELTTTSPIHRCHYGRPNYVCSAYFSERPFKTEIRPGVWNEDVQDLHFADREFDVIVSSETMEHVRNPWIGFRSIHRVLKPGGLHCFTIPYHSDRSTLARVDITGPADIDLLPRVYHNDPHRPEDSLVYTDFGSDLARRLEEIGFVTTEHLIRDERCDIHDDRRPMRVFLSEKTV
jgi:SAM-dependent methyltransferase